MFLQTFQTTFSAVFEVLLLTASGYFLVKRKILNEEGLSQVSNLTVTLLFPAFTFFQLTTNFRYERYPDWWAFPLVSLLLMLLGYGLGKLAMTFIEDKVREDEFLSLLAFQNSGNIPLMIVITLFPTVLAAQLNVNILLFGIGFNLAIWTLGVKMLLKGRQVALQMRELLNPPFLATVLTLFIIFLGWHRLIPAVVVKTAGLFGDCALPISMLVVGGNLAAINLADFDRKTMGLLVLVKLVLMPLVALLAVLFLRLEFGWGFLIVIEAAVPSAVTLSLITRYYNIEEKIISQGLFYTHVLSIVTVPIFLAFYLALARF